MRLSSIAYYADFAIAAAGICALAYASGIDSESTTRSALTWLLCAALGFIAWTLFEYVVHRVLYHAVPMFKDVHDAHHREPNAFIGAPPVVGPLMISAITYLPLSLWSPGVASGATAGMLLGYMAYMLIHHAAHFWNPRPGSWLHGARRHHALHHFRDEDGNFGITTSLWDHVFGTALQPKSAASKRLQTR